jgi:acyl-CoA thioesterase FadM
VSPEPVVDGEPVVSDASADWRWVTDSPARPDEFDWLDHLSNVGVVRVLADARSEWLISLGPRPPGGAYVVRHLVVSYDGEARPSDHLRCGVVAVARSSRSLTFEQRLWADGDRLVASARAVQVSFDANTRRAVEIWPAALAAIEARQGLPPLRPRPPGPA